MRIHTYDVQCPAEVTRESVKASGWWNSTDHPLQDNRHVAISIRTQQQFQSWEGLGGAVSELGWIALQKLDDQTRHGFFQSCFCKKKGLGMDWIRLPVGSSDFYLTDRSFSHTPNDLEMREFSIEEDKKRIIPYIRAALAVNPDLRIHASPWSPPAWMKQNGSMCGDEKGQIREEGPVLAAYAVYLRKFVEAYAEEGIAIHRLFVQNEMDSCSLFPTCRWSSDVFVRFHLEYLRPEFERSGIETEVWAGTFRTMTGLEAHDCFANQEFKRFVKGVGFQYSYPHVIQDFRALHPDVSIMHTESVCHNGGNTHSQAVAQMDDFIGYMKANISAFSYWNMVLEKGQASTWGWRQNSLFTVDAQTGTLVANPDYQIYKLIADHLQTGARRVMSFSYLLDTLCLKNPDGSLCLFLKNLEGPRQARIDVDGTQRSVDLAGHSVCAITISPNQAPRC
jgi:glucosylceramidase